MPRIRIALLAILVLAPLLAHPGHGHDTARHAADHLLIIVVVGLVLAAGLGLLFRIVLRRRAAARDPAR